MLVAGLVARRRSTGAAGLRAAAMVGGAELRGNRNPGKRSGLGKEESWGK